MSAATIELKDWLETLKDALHDYAGRSLRFDGANPAELGLPAESPRPAAYVAILGERSSMHLGLSTSMEGCRVLVRALLGMRQREAIADSEVVDGMSEILNIVAGKVKSRLVVRDGTLKLGLPMFVQGQVGLGENTERASADILVGPVPCQIVVFRRNRL